MHTSTQAPLATSDTTLAHHIARPQRGTMPWRLSPLAVTTVAGAGELTVLAVTGLVVAGLWVGIEELVALQHGYTLAILATALSAVLAAERQGLYKVATLRSPLRHLWRVGGCWTGAVGLLLGALFLLKSGTDFSRGWVLLWLVAGLGGMLAWRAGARQVVRNLASAGHLERRAVVYGAGPEGAELVRRLEADTDSDVRIVGIFDDRGTDRVPDSLAGYPMLGNADQLVAFCRAQEVDMLILSIPFTAERRLLQILSKLWVLPIDIRLAAHTTALRFRPRAYSHVGSVPMIDLFDRPLAEWDQRTKSLRDSPRSGGRSR
jgi:FlaA1/EpsC-like NDP-sugar epimerase